MDILYINDLQISLGKLDQLRHFSLRNLWPHASTYGQEDPDAEG